MIETSLVILVCAVAVLLPVLAFAAGAQCARLAEDERRDKSSVEGRDVARWQSRR